MGHRLLVEGPLSLALLSCLLWAGGCSEGSDGGTPGASAGLPAAGGSATGSPSGGAGGAGTGGGGAPPQPEQHVPCDVGDCWQAAALPGGCGTSTIQEDFSTGLYNVHEFPLLATADAPLEATLAPTGGSWAPALLVRDADGVMLHDGEVAGSDGTVHTELVSTGQDSDVAAVRITATEERSLYLFVTSWGVVDSGFADPMPADASYDLTVLGDCESSLLSPPNFDPNDQDADGYYVLPDSEPPGLYTHKHDDCSRGTKLLIDVLYTVAYHWNQQRPEYSPIDIRDLNEAWCSSVDHATHDDGTHADLVAGCATQVSCSDKDPVVELAKLVIDTGEACGIINDNTQAVRDEVNGYFQSRYSYEPWHGTFMRTVGGHTHHMHIRVKKPDGTCN